MKKDDGKKQQTAMKIPNALVQSSGGTGHRVMTQRLVSFADFCGRARRLNHYLGFNKRLKDLRVILGLGKKAKLSKNSPKIGDSILKIS
jgi:hypothetical protein